MTRTKKAFRLITVGAALWLTAGADFPMDLVTWLLGEAGCC